MKYYLTCEKPGMMLSEMLQRSDISFELPCSGNGICGKCKVRITQGSLSPIGEAEKKLLKEAEVKEGYRLACFTEVFSDVIVDREEKTADILAEGLYGDYPLDRVFKKEEYGVAIDIGTTTIVINLFKGDSSYLIGRAAELNNQRKFGADIISRIEYSMTKGLSHLHFTIVNQINKMIDDLCKRMSIKDKEIKYGVITGNTVMLHFFNNFEPDGMAFYPFTPKSLFGDYINTDIGLNISPEAKIYIPPCVSSYVGADTVCAILSSKMTDKKESSLIIDMGTNGEIGLFIEDEVICCATAAGPAFEGVGIDYGSPAVEGAISTVYFDESSYTIKYKTIGDKDPVSICGSGIIDAAAVLLRRGIIDKTGRIQKEGHSFSKNIVEREESLFFKFHDCDITISQKDIRQIQLAKGAIAGGINTLLSEKGIEARDIDRLYICGGFGHHLNLDSAEYIGLIPPGSKDKAMVIGNGALSGASEIVLNKLSIEKCRGIADKCRDVELSTNPYFMEEFIKQMSFI